MDVTLRDLKVIKTISEEGNLTQAADKLCVSQSALSHQLKKIESTLRMPVFHRINKKMKLTPSGNRILMSSERILKEVDTLKDDLMGMSDGTTGTVRISTECYTCYHWLPPVLKDFQEVYPKARVKVVSEATRNPMHYLANGELDLAISSELPDEKEFESKLLFSDEMLIVMSANHALAKKKVLTPQDFTGQTMILYDVPDNDLFFLREIIKPNRIELRQVMKLELTEAIIEMVAAGMGIGVIANWAIRDYLEPKNLVTFPVPIKRVKRSWYAITKRQASIPVARAFMDFIEPEAKLGM
ncbi:MAG: LysR family transcriptional regulator [Bacteroidia bacterium]|nr:LysR family transcriptional regulator [Bacteroidia bacterium]